MKGSDSTNSLTELTGRDECFICLAVENEKDEPLVSSKLLRTCGCKFFVHPACWNVWLKDKTDYDCPICRKDSILRIHIPPNPVFYAEGHELVPERRWCTKYQLFFTCILVIFAIALLVSLIQKD
jgi:hypothetical protein